MKSSERTRELLIKHYQDYPNLKIQDIFKYLYQSSFGCEHLVSSLPTVIDYIKNESQACLQNHDNLIDALDGEYSRVHLSYMNYGLSAETLGKLFFASAQKENNGRFELEKKLEAARELLRENKLPFTVDYFDKSVNDWKEIGYPAIHHSDDFRNEYSPSYRVISNKYVRFLPLFAKIDALLLEKRAIIAIDGGSASGKTTLAGMLESLYDCTVFHMDDFFLRPEQRTKQRYEEVGGNVDRERFLEEVLIPLSKNEPVNYKRFDCSAMTVDEGEIIVPQRLVVIEGAYSMHTELSDYYDLSVFLDIDSNLQKKRIAKRNSPELAERFFNDWIPLEKIYFSQMQVASRCDICISVSEEIV